MVVLRVVLRRLVRVRVRVGVRVRVRVRVRIASPNPNPNPNPNLELVGGGERARVVGVDGAEDGRVHREEDGLCGRVRVGHVARRLVDLAWLG